MTSPRTSHVFKMDGGHCYSGNELFQVREQTEQQPRLGLIRWRKYAMNQCGAHSYQVFLNPADIRNLFLIWMDEKQIATCCPKLSERFLEGKISKLGPQLKGDKEGEAMKEEMKIDVKALVERCDNVLESYKNGELADYAMTMFANNVAVLAAYAKVPQLLQCLLDSGVVKLLADAMLNCFRDEDVHENSSQVLHALVSHNYDNKSADIILQFMNFITDCVENDDMPICLQFEGVTLTIVDLFASTIKIDCCPSLEQIPYPEVPNHTVWYVLCYGHM